MAYFVTTIGTTITTCIITINELVAAFQLSDFIHTVVFLLWFYFAMASVSSFFARILLQLINNLRAQYSDDWKWQLNPMYMKWVIKYYYILGNPSRLLTILSSLWITTVIITTFILYSTRSYEIFFICVSGIYTTKFAIILYLAKYVNRKDTILNSWYIWREFKYVAIYSNLTIAFIIIEFVVEFIVFEFEATEYALIFTMMTGIVGSVINWYLITFWVQNIHANTYSNNITKDKLNSVTPNQFLTSVVEMEQCM